MMRNFSNMFLRARRALEFSHGLGQNQWAQMEQMFAALSRIADMGEPCAGAGAQVGSCGEGQGSGRRPKLPPTHSNPRNLLAKSASPSSDERVPEILRSHRRDVQTVLQQACAMQLKGSYRNEDVPYRSGHSANKTFVIAGLAFNLGIFM
jgi:hypothetical protein